MPSFVARHSAKAALSVAGTFAVIALILATHEWLDPSIAKAHPLLITVVYMSEMSLLSVGGSYIVYHLQAAWAAPPGHSINEQSFRNRLHSYPPFALYLRNFRSEVGASSSPVTDHSDVRPHMVWVPNIASGIEVRLHGLLRPKYHLFCIENAYGDTIPYFDTVVCDHTIWPETVRLALERAALVVLAAEAKSPGLVEEINLILEAARERTWLIYSASLALAVPELSALQTVAPWQTEIPDWQQFRHLSDLEVPSGLDAVLCQSSDA